MRATARPPQAKPDDYGARAGRTTVLHPLDNDSAPEGRLLSIVDVDQPTGGARVEISPDGQTIVLQLPDKARDTSFDYYIDDGRSNSRPHATVSVAVRAARRTTTGRCARATSPAVARPARRLGHRPGALRLARRQRRRHPGPRLGAGRGR